MQRTSSSSGRSTPAASSSSSSLTAEELSFADTPRPFKNPYYLNRTTAGPGGGGGKRTKALKQIMALERERVDQLLEAKKQQLVAGAGDDAEAQLQQAFHQVVSFASVEAPPSLLPQKRYCDITGLEAKYQDPRSTLRYHNAEVYEVLRTFQPAVIQAYLAVRGQGVVLR
ncbi:hypothetical protein JCM8115_006494 [Rhodotorula mucilaginosa]|uniref:Chromatin-remodeling complex subunit ies6 n=1 Tax=Rhodotorula mucilaginosa TaxID=5537 RepID=A0A9P6W5H0_RHOMI|nr:chromatin-remodeling complex subunit ies6 [Rhodotorula mucilaginosa]TKA56997.1 hypothetical protein B0A53_01399 [Rhodotorula sp. CCFEE 5036]